MEDVEIPIKKGQIWLHRFKKKKVQINQDVNGQWQNVGYRYFDDSGLLKKNINFKEPRYFRYDFILVQDVGENPKCPRCNRMTNLTKIHGRMFCYTPVTDASKNNGEKYCGWLQ
jgi:hypothetical protein